MKRLNFYNMKQSLLDNPEDIDEIYDAFALMKQLGYIADNDWKQFEDECRYWEYSDNIMGIWNCDSGAIVKVY